MSKALILQRIHEAGVQALTDAGIDHVSAPDADRATLLRMIPEFDGLVVRTTSYRIDAEVMDAAPNLKVIGRHGVGVDHIDVVAAAERGITVVNAPEANSQGVAEYTVGLMLMVARGMRHADAAVRKGDWAAREQLIGSELTGGTLGIIGLGRVGSRIARICRYGFSMRVLYYDIVRKDDYEQEIGVEFASFDEVVAASDILTLHVPLTELTRRMMNRETIRRMRSGAILMNASRGQVVELDSVVEAIQSGKLAGAGIDVFPDEPLPTDHPILALPEVVVSPHMASHSDMSMIRMALVTEDVARVLNGVEPKNPVLPE
jgi:D-3-phosphoglycerate dehydrogenase / 2-oxoglutarate reductase